MEDSSTRPYAEGRIPASDPSEYKFSFADAESVELGKEMSEVAGEAAFAIGANKAYAEATVKHLQERIARVAAGAVAPMPNAIQAPRLLPGHAATGPQRANPDREVHVYHPTNAGLYTYEAAHKIGDPSFHLVVIGIKQPQ